MNKQSSESPSISDWWNLSSNLSMSEWLNGPVSRPCGVAPDPKTSAPGLDRPSTKAHRGQVSLEPKSLPLAVSAYFFYRQQSPCRGPL